MLRPENITNETFAEVAPFESWFEDKTVDMDDPNHWFEVDVVGLLVGQMFIFGKDLAGGNKLMD
jgi:hypothetical protein